MGEFHVAAPAIDRASLPVLYGSLLASNKDPEDEVQSLERERAPKSRENQGEPTQGKQELAGKVLNSNGSNAGSENEARGQDLRSSERRIVQEYEVYVKAVINTMNRSATLESTELAKEIILFGAQLAKFAKADTGAQRKSAIYTSLRRLNKEYPTISLSVNFLEKYLRQKGITLQHDTKIYIAEPAYVENVFDLLRRTRRYQVKNYVGWKIIATLAPFVSPLRAHHHKFMAQYGFHEKRKKDICTESIAVKASPMGHLVSKMFVERKFSLEAKKNVQLMSELIQRELVTSLSNLRWRTHQARKTALKAVTEMAKLIGYPDWMDNDDTVAGLFSNVRNFTEQSPFVKVSEEYRMAAFHGLMKKLSTPYSTSDEWSGAPTDVTFGYDASTNMICKSIYVALLAPLRPVQPK